MLCNYQNITDYCTNKFSYQYYDVVSAGPGQLAATGNNLSPVVRTDKDTGEKIVLYPDSTLIIEPCSDSDDELETISAWQCYQLFLSSDDAVVAPADISIVKNKQIDNVNADFYSSLNDGLIININGYSPIVLKTSIEDQVNYGNIAMLANMLYAEDTDNPMPALLDVNNMAYYLSYSVLNEILTKYFNSFASKKYIKDDSVKKINSDNMTLDDINLEYFCVGKIPGSYTGPTLIQDPVIKEPPVLPPNESCDPPCDPDSCKSCVNGECVELCEENQCCYNGLCIDCLSCEFNADCNLCDSQYVTKFDNSHESCPGAGCVDCEVLASICSDLGGTYFEIPTIFGKTCNCRDTPSFATSLNNCDHLITADTLYVGVDYDFESGLAYCCDNKCQIDPC